MAYSSFKFEAWHERKRDQSRKQSSTPSLSYFCSLTCFSHVKIAYSKWKEKIFEKSVTIEFQLTEKKTRIRHFMSMSLILFIFSDKLKKPNVIFSYYLHFPIILLCKVDYYIIAYQQSFAWKSTLTTLVIFNSWLSWTLVQCCTNYMRRKTKLRKEEIRILVVWSALICVQPRAAGGLLDRFQTIIR